MARRFVLALGLVPLVGCYEARFLSEPQPTLVRIDRLSAPVVLCAEIVTGSAHPTTEHPGAYVVVDAREAVFVTLAHAVQAAHEGR